MALSSAAAHAGSGHRTAIVRARAFLHDEKFERGAASTLRQRKPARDRRLDAEPGAAAALTFYTPEVTEGTWIAMHFSLRLTGHREAGASTFTGSSRQVDDNMHKSHEGSWGVRPTYRLEFRSPDGGGHAERDIDLILEGVIAPPNGHAVTLISIPGTRTVVSLWGPPGSACAASSSASSQ